MKILSVLFEGMKLAALFGAVVLVVWNMPDYQNQQTVGDQKPVVAITR